MKTENLNLQDLTSSEMEEINGGFPFLAVAIGCVIVGGIIGYFVEKRRQSRQE